MGTARLATVLTFVVIAFAIWSFRPGRGQPDAPAVLARVQRLNQLATVKYTIQQVIGLTEQKSPVGSESILLILQASVESGIDMASMHPGAVTVRSDGTVVLRLPPAKILNVTIDEKATKVWDRAKTWWTPWVPYSLTLEQKARLQGVEAAKVAALEMGILGQAERNAEISIRELLTLGGVKSVVIVPGSS
ncbi:MAG: DUF4230 domain-containing protein [Bryobacteraceae bacterium]